MDKLQKQLIDTYFRKRRIKAETNIDDYNLYEIGYILTNDLDTSGFDRYSTMIAADKYPAFISKLNLNILYSIDIYQILTQRPELATLFDASKLNRYETYRLLSVRPELGEWAIVDKFDGNSIAKLLSQHPTLIKKFDLNNLNALEISDVLEDQPKLAPYFEKRIEFLKKQGIYVRWAQ